MARARSDMLGGLLPSLSASESAARARALQTQDKLAMQWPMIPSLNSIPHKTLKTLCRKGIPASLRPSAWLLLSGGANRRSANPDLYRKLSASTSDLGDDLIYAIEEDVRSGFNGNRLVASPKGAEALNRMLFALVQYLSIQEDRQFVYTRGTAQLAALVLVVFELSREEDAFWTLASLIHEKLFPYSSDSLQFGGRVEQGILKQLVQRKMPHIATHLLRLDLSLDKLTANWFPLLFVTALPTETAVRVWDGVMCEGSKVALRVALALIKKYEAVIVGGSTSDLVYKVWKLRTSRTFDADELLDSAFHHTGSMSSASIGKLRQSVCDTLRKAPQQPAIMRSATEQQFDTVIMRPSSSLDGLASLGLTQRRIFEARDMPRPLSA